VEHVGVGRKRAFAALVPWHRDLVLLGELDQCRAAGQVPFAPRGDDLDVGRQRVIAELEADLVVAFPGRAVGHRIGPDLARDLDLPLGDQWPRNRGAEQIQPFVECIGAHHRENIVADELLLEVVDEDMFGANPHQLGLGPRRLQFLALPQVGGEGHHFALVGDLKPLQDDAGIEPARKGEHHAAQAVGHYRRHPR
jgi:hypothetical protein